MSQYPIPPEQPSEGTLPLALWTKTYRPSDRRFRHVPLVKGHPDGTIEVLRGDPELAAELAALPQAQALFDHRIGRTFFVARNRLGQVTLVQSGKTIAGLLEMALYTQLYWPPGRWRRQSTFAEVRQALVEELARIDELEADGWELVRYPEGENGCLFLVDSLRPDDPVEGEDLPAPASMDRNEFSYWPTPTWPFDE